MAGGIEKDPAIERWAMMRENTHLYFRLTPLTVTAGVISLIVVPIALYYGIEYGNVFIIFLTVCLDLNYRIWHCLCSVVMNRSKARNKKRIMKCRYLQIIYFSSGPLAQW